MQASWLIFCEFSFWSIFYSDKLWRSVKVRCEYGDVVKSVEEAKRRKEAEALKLPTIPSDNTSTISSSLSSTIAPGFS